MRSNRKLLVPTKIAIATCSIFFAISLLVGNFFGTAIVQSNSPKLSGSNYVIKLDENNPEAKPLSYQEMETVFDKTSLGSEGNYFIDDGISLSTFVEPMLYTGRAYPSPKSLDYFPYKLERGSLPLNDDEIVLSLSFCNQLGLDIGDKIRLGLMSNPLDGYQAGTDKEYTISGISFVNQNTFTYDGLIITEAAFDNLNEIKNYSSVVYDAYIYTAGKELSEEDKQALQEALGQSYLIKTSEQVIQEEYNKMFGKGINPVQAVSMVFVMLAIGVGCMVISNTFRVLVARQRRVIALLRSIGATQKQIYRMVIKDALSMAFFTSLIASAIPLIIVKLAEFVKLRIGPLVIMNIVRPSYIIYPVVVITIATLLAVISSARMATRVSPLEALQVIDIHDEQDKKLKLGIFKILLLIVGLVLMVYAYLHAKQISYNVFMNPGDDLANQILLNIFMAIMASFAVFIAIVATTKFWLVKLLKLIAKLSSKKNPDFYIATFNVQKNPRRTSITSSALLIGIILVSTVMTGASSTTATLNKELAEKFPIDMQVSYSAEQFEQNKKLVDKIMDNEEVFERKEIVPGYRGTLVSVNGLSLNDMPEQPILTLNSYDSEKLSEVSKLEFPSIAENELVITPDTAKNLNEIITAGKIEDRSTVDFQFSNGETRTLTLRINRAIRNLSNIDINIGFISPELSSSLDIPVDFYNILLRVSDKANPQVMMKFSAENAGVLSSGGNVSGSYLMRKLIEQAIITILYVMLGLMGTTVVIAIIGVSNTLILSVIERRKETASLRVIGMTQRQVKKSLVYESFLITAVSSIVGLLVGIIFGYYGCQILVGTLMNTNVSLALNWPGLALIVVLTIICSWISSIAPTKEALRHSPIEALGNE